MAAFGVDTFDARLDSVNWTTFETWNGGSPAFAGRSFLGDGSFLWAPAEDTNALTAPSPTDYTKLVVRTPLIAPVQAPMAKRQNVTGERGQHYGAQDANALCRRIAASVRSGELNMPSGLFANIYLAVDSSVNLSSDYWAGWADTVTHFAILGLLAPIMIYQPCLLCRFTKGGDQKLACDPQVLAAVTQAGKDHPDLATACAGLWADAPDLDSQLQQPNATIDWTGFATSTTPIFLWRFARNLLDAAGNALTTPKVVNTAGITLTAPIAVDAVNDSNPKLPLATTRMFSVNQWQPSATVVGHGFSSTEAIKTNTDAVAKILSTAVVPKDVRGESCGTSTIEQGNLTIVGRYIHPTAAESISRAEADLMSKFATPRLFTTYEGGGATNRAYYAAAQGTADANIAFPYAAQTLQQPPNTLIFFAIDWSNDNPVAADKTWIQGYLNAVKAAYDVYLAANPDWPYLMGVYGSGVILAWAYELRFISGFWQSGSMCRTGNHPPLWPWPHGTRWQYNVSPPTNPMIGGIGGEDLDADWGDGGDWSLSDPIAVRFRNFLSIERGQAALAGQQMMAEFHNLLQPPPESF